MKLLKSISYCISACIIFTNCDDNIFQSQDEANVNKVEVTVTFQDDPVPNATVCLYNNLSIRNANGANCNNSILDSVTNSLGVVDFIVPDLSTFYITAIAKNGDEEINNLNDHPETIFSTENATIKNGVAKVIIKLFALNQLASLDRSTRLKLKIKDEQNFVVRDATVCIYENQNFQRANAPGCAGSLVQAVSNKDGEVLFSNLNTQQYYINSSASSGVLFLDNTQNDEDQRTNILKENELNEKVIVLRVLPNMNSAVRIMVRDPLGNAVSDANVCIYDDVVLANEDKPFCFNSTQAGKTDLNGVIIFNNLDAIKYYINVNAVVNGDTLNNLQNVQSTAQPLEVGETREITIRIFDD